jgi:hypothetical protein
MGWGFRCELVDRFDGPASASDAADDRGARYDDTVTIAAVAFLGGLAAACIACSTGGTGEPSGRADFDPALTDASNDVVDTDTCDYFTAVVDPLARCPCEAGATVTCGTCCSAYVTLAMCTGGFWSPTGRDGLCGCGADPQRCEGGSGASDAADD